MDDSILLTLKELVLEKQQASALDDILSERLQAENHVRRLKRRNQACGFLRNGVCTRLDIRCGERQQYRLPEDEEDREKPHRCNYLPNASLSDSRILIVEDDPSALELYRAYFGACGVDVHRIETAESVTDAQEILRQGKIRNQRYSIVMSDVELGKESGFELVNHLV